VPPAALVAQLYPQHYSHQPWGAQEPSTPPLHQKSLLREGRSGGSSGQPSFDDHAGKAGLPIDRLTLLANLASTLSSVPSSVCAALVDPNWCHTMEEEFAALIANNT
jgi:hypothetical protein